ncbi:MAG: Chemotaxis protein, partial [Massilia sp.]|nr:Chemotaxis protein [Massilia sp.]
MEYSTLAKARPALVLAGAAGASTLVIFLIGQAVPGALG